MTVETHFVQPAEGPALAGTGSDTFCCDCGSVLISGYQPGRILAVGIQCARCGSVTATPGLAVDARPPRDAIVAKPSTEARDEAMAVPIEMPLVGQAEMVRIQALFQPASPDPVYVFSDALLDEVRELFAHHTGGSLDAVATDHPLGAAVRYLRAKVRSESWSCMEDSATSIAVDEVAAFLHFLRTWSQHPFLPAMIEGLAERRFDVHGLATFAAAHCLTMMGNRIRFPEPLGYPARIDSFGIVSGDDLLAAELVALGPGSPHEAVSAAIAAAQARINLRAPGMLLLSSGNKEPAYDDAVVAEMRTVMRGVGRKNRGLMAVAWIAQRLQAWNTPHAVRFVQAFYPVANRHYRGPNALRVNEPTAA